MSLGPGSSLHRKVQRRWGEKRQLGRTQQSTVSAPRWQHSAVYNHPCANVLTGSQHKGVVFLRVAPNFIQLIKIEVNREKVRRASEKRKENSRERAGMGALGVKGTS